MTDDLTPSPYDSLIGEFTQAEGVTMRPDGLYVHGKLFAFLHGGDLVVELPAGRLQDLSKRGIAEAFTSRASAAGDWARISDFELWLELVREAHEFVGEPAIGGQS